MLQKRERFLSCGNTRLYCAPTLATYVFYAYFTNSTKYSILNNKLSKDTFLKLLRLFLFGVYKNGV